MSVEKRNNVYSPGDLVGGFLLVPTTALLGAFIVANTLNLMTNEVPGSEDESHRTKVNMIVPIVVTALYALSAAISPKIRSTATNMFKRVTSFCRQLLYS